MKCKECRWFDSQRTEADEFDSKTEKWTFIQVGICRKSPPQRTVFQDDGRTSCGWPVTRSTDWCGEWENLAGSSLDDRIVQFLKNWRDTHDGKPMPRWKLRRSVGDNEAELALALERLVKNGSLEVVHIQTKGRPFSGCKLT